MYPQNVEQIEQLTMVTTMTMIIWRGILVSFSYQAKKSPFARHCRRPKQVGTNDTTNTTKPYYFYKCTNANETAMCIKQQTNSTAHELNMTASKRLRSSKSSDEVQRDGTEPWCGIAEQLADGDSSMESTGEGEASNSVHDSKCGGSGGGVKDWSSCRRLERVSGKVGTEKRQHSDGDRKNDDGDVKCGLPKEKRE
jgi:hypothetical protein